MVHVYTARWMAGWSVLSTSDNTAGQTVSCLKRNVWNFDWDVYIWKRRIIRLFSACWRKPFGKIIRHKIDASMFHILFILFYSKRLPRRQNRILYKNYIINYECIVVTSPRYRAGPVRGQGGHAPACVRVCASRPPRRSNKEIMLDDVYVYSY